MGWTWAFPTTIYILCASGHYKADKKGTNSSELTSTQRKKEIRNKNG
jgi:hypothetical protein